MTEDDSIFANERIKDDPIKLSEEKELLLDWLYQCGDNWSLSIVEDTCAYLKHPKAPKGKQQYCFCRRKQYAIGSRSTMQDVPTARKDIQRKVLKYSDIESLKLGGLLFVEGVVKGIKGLWRMLAFSFVALIDGMKTLFKKTEKKKN